MNYKKLLVALFTFYFHYANAQIDIENIIESIVNETCDEIDYSTLTERLYYYHQNPININKASKEQLQELLFLSPLQINQLLHYRTINGLFINTLELQAIESIDTETVQKIMPFITTGSSKLFNNQSIKQIMVNADHDLIIRYKRLLEMQRGFNNSESPSAKYLGCPNHLQARYKFNFKNTISGSVSMEKDPGEEFFSGANRGGFDFYSGNITIKDWGKVKKLIIGDYALQFGEGLTLWSGLSFGKGAEITTLAKQDIGLKPHTSMNEHSFFRGVAAVLASKSIRISPFISYKAIDVNLKNDQISTLQTSGLHRTSSEINNKNSGSEFVFGSNIQFSKKLFNASATVYRSLHSHPFQQGKYLYNQFKFSGNYLTNVGISYNYTFHNSYIFGEIAHNIGGGYAFLNGIISALSPKVSISLLHRNYQKNYHSLYNQALSEATSAVNEIGFYSGLVIKPNTQWEWFGYADAFKFPWLKFNVDAPSKGYELFSQLTYKPNKKFKLTTRYRLKVKEENNPLKSAIKTIQQVKKQNYRAEVHYQIGTHFQFRNRVELVQHQSSVDNLNWGHLIYHDVIFSPLQSNFSGNIRIAIYDIPNYDARIYAYEHDVLYSYTIQAYQDKGWKCYINTRYNIRKELELYCKYGLSLYSNKRVFGTGMDQINGNTRSEVHVQLRYQF